MKAKTGNILLVEDNAKDAEITIRTLQKKGVANEIYWVKDGAEALDFIHARGTYAGRDPKNLPQLVLLDLRLPKVEGLEVLKALRGNPSFKLLPVVVLTSSTEEEDIVRSYELGVNSYVSKPVNFEDFSSVIEQLGMYWLLVNRRPSLSIADNPDAE